LHASLFGSAARGDGKTSSDIDVFVVRPSAIDENDQRWREQLERLSRDVHRWTGNHLGLAEVSKHDVRRLRRIKPAVASELRRDAITLVGPPVSELLGRAP
jgi:predicted nucleotidyltransferase